LAGKRSCGEIQVFDCARGFAYPRSIGLGHGRRRNRLLASISFALSAVYGGLGLRHSTPVATTPLFSLLLSLIFLRGKEHATSRTILGPVAVVGGTIAITLGK